ncbi:MAG: hypothetical protein IJB66_07575 [Oscillospiraceae bacterium]|nr:hypothetical protein [Oscillospiraceae bacterium]
MVYLQKIFNFFPKKADAEGFFREIPAKKPSAISSPRKPGAYYILCRNDAKGPRESLLREGIIPTGRDGFIKSAQGRILSARFLLKAPLVKGGWFWLCQNRGDSVEITG